MSILFSEIYTKSIALFDDPKITKAYETSKIQFDKIMYTYLQNVIGLFNNPVSIGVRLSNYKEPNGVMEIYNNPGTQRTFDVDGQIDLTKANCIYDFIQDGKHVQGTINILEKKITFPETEPPEKDVKQYSFEQYYVGEFLDDFNLLNSRTSIGNKLIVGEIKDILARMLVKAWAEEERNLLVDIRNLMQDSDFKITGNDKVLKAKNSWVDQLDNEILLLLNKLSWNIRFMNGSQKIGRG